MTDHSGRPTPRSCAVRRQGHGVRAGASLLVALVAVAAACGPPPPGFPEGTSALVVVYGDSLVVDATPAIRDRLAESLPGWQVRIRAVSGSAQCDWHQRMQADAGDRPAVVVLAFYGNRLTRCAASRPWPQLYATDAWFAAQFWSARAGTQLVFVGAPPRVGEATNPVARTYRDVAAATGTRFVDSSPYFLGADGVATTDVACIEGESAAQGCVAGRIDVRSADGVHFCDWWSLSCHADSAGARRYAEVITSGAAAAAGVGFRPRSTTTPPPTTEPPTTELPAGEPPPTTEPTTTSPPTTSPPTTEPQPTGEPPPTTEPDAGEPPPAG